MTYPSSIEPMITMVVPVYNRANIVKRTLDSLQRQNYRPLRIILVDNDSADDTLSTLHQWADAVRDTTFQVDVISCKTPGAAAARNAGLALVRSPWVMFFDSDDTMHPYHVERVVKAIKGHRTVDLVGWDVMIHNQDGSKSVKKFKHRHLLYDCVLHGLLSTQRYACRTDLIRDCGSWDERLGKWIDIEMGSRLVTRYPEIHVFRLNGKPTVDVWVSENSITGPSFFSRAAESEYALTVMSRSIKPSLQYIVNLKRVILAGDYYLEGHKVAAHNLRDYALADTPKIWHRMLLRTAYAYRSMGGRGIARLLYPLF